MDKTIELLKKSDALLEGHFLLSSGKHSDRYIQCAKLIQHPEYCKEVSEIIAEKLKENNIVIISYEVAKALGVDAIFTERVDNEMTLRRGFEIPKGAKVIIVEDVITTGKSSFETVDVIRSCGAEVVALTSIVNRSNKEKINGLPVISATKIDVKTYDADDLPEHLKNTEAIKPGSRKIIQ